jgi:hypothetical protein
MPGLILKLRAHEQVLVNGVVMQNGDRNTRLIVKTPDAKILRLRDAIHPDDVDTPVKRVCYIAQVVVAGEADQERADASVHHLLHGVVHAFPRVHGLEPGGHELVHLHGVPSDGYRLNDGLCLYSKLHGYSTFCESRPLFGKSGPLGGHSPSSSPGGLKGQPRRSEAKESEKE